MKTDNIFILKGFVGQDPELRETKNHKKVINLSIGENTVSSDGEIRTNWFQATAWDKVAIHIDQNIKKGMLVRIEGKISPRILEIDDKKYPTINLVINSIEQILYKKQESESIEEPDMPDDLPM